jgi:transcriptional antiterminator RfaH
MVPSGPVWYCARTKPKHEHIAAANVSNHLSLEVFNPRLRVERTTSRGVVRVVEPLFPCYVFVRCDGTERLDQIRYTSGISSLVNFGGRIPVVPDQVIQELKGCFGSGEPVAVGEAIAVGSEVTVSLGPFMGARAVVVKMLPAKRRVQVLLEFLGRTTLAEVDRGWLSVENQSLADLLPGLARVIRPPVGDSNLGRQTP